jgi:hypothetical protein
MIHRHLTLLALVRTMLPSAPALLLAIGSLVGLARADEAAFDRLGGEYRDQVHGLMKRFCLECH